MCLGTVRRLEIFGRSLCIQRNSQISSTWSLEIGWSHVQPQIGDSTRTFNGSFYFQLLAGSCGLPKHGDSSSSVQETEDGAYNGARVYFGCSKYLCKKKRADVASFTKRDYSGLATSPNWLD
ncbi:hypothetical protein AHAS_Ahas13G0177400 [Arachis hypogaea]